MRNLKKMATMLVLVTVIGVTSSLGGVLVGDRQINNEPAPTTATCTNGGSINTGVIIGGVIIGGVIIGGVIIGGVIIGGVNTGIDTDGPCVLGSTD